MHHHAPGAGARRCVTQQMDRAVGASGWRTRRSSRAGAASPLTSPSRTSFTCAWCAPSMRTATSFPLTPQRHGRCREWWQCGPRPIFPTCRRSIFARGRSRRSRLIASRCSRASGCATSGEPVAAVFARGSLHRRGRCRSRHHGGRGACRRCSTADAEPGEFIVRPRHRSRHYPSGLRRRGGGVKSAAHVVVELEAHQRPPFRRAVGDARRDRPLRRFPRHSGIARRCQGAAPEQGPDRAHARPRAVMRALHESHVGGGFGIRGELYPEDVLVCVAAMRFDRPVKWIEDRREHLSPPTIRATSTTAFAPASTTRAHPRHRRHLLSRPRCLCAHPRRPRRA